MSFEKTLSFTIFTTFGIHSQTCVVQYRWLTESWVFSSAMLQESQLSDKINWLVFSLRAPWHSEETLSWCYREKHWKTFMMNASGFTCSHSHHMDNGILTNVFFLHSPWMLPGRPSQRWSAWSTRGNWSGRPVTLSLTSHSCPSSCSLARTPAPWV